MEYARTGTPTEAEHAAILDFFRRTFPHFIRCPDCRRHYRRRLTRQPPPAYADATPGALLRWFVELHDSVNVRLKRGVYGIERARADYAALTWNAKRRIVYEALELFAFEYSLEAEEDELALTIADSSPDVASSTTVDPSLDVSSSDSNGNNKW